MPGVFGGYRGDDAAAYDRRHEFPFTYRELVPYYEWVEDRKSTRLNSSHANISYAVFCLKKKSSIGIFFLVSIAQFTCDLCSTALLGLGAVYHCPHLHFTCSRCCTMTRSSERVSTYGRPL